MVAWWRVFFFACPALPEKGKGHTVKIRYRDMGYIVVGEFNLTSDRVGKADRLCSLALPLLTDCLIGPMNVPTQTKRLPSGRIMVTRRSVWHPAPPSVLSLEFRTDKPFTDDLRDSFRAWAAFMATGPLLTFDAHSVLLLYPHGVTPATAVRDAHEAAAALAAACAPCDGVGLVNSAITQKP